MANSLYLEKDGISYLTDGSEHIKFNLASVKQINVDTGTEVRTVWRQDSTRPALNITGWDADDENIYCIGNITDDNGLGECTMQVGSGTKVAIPIESDGHFSCGTAKGTDSQTVTIDAVDLAGNHTTVKTDIAQTGSLIGSAGVPGNGGTSQRHHEASCSFTSYFSNLDTTTITGVTVSHYAFNTDVSSAAFYIYDNKNNLIDSWSCSGTSGTRAHTFNLTQYTPEYVKGMRLVATGYSSDSGDTKDSVGHWNTHTSCDIAASYSGFKAIQYPQLYFNSPLLSDGQTVYTIGPTDEQFEIEVIPGTYPITKVMLNDDEITDNLSPEVTLEPGDNVFTATVTDGTRTVEYTFTINNYVHTNGLGTVEEVGNYGWIHQNGGTTNYTELSAASTGTVLSNGIIYSHAGFARQITPDIKSAVCSFSHNGHTSHGDEGIHTVYIFRADGTQIWTGSGGTINFEANGWNTGQYWIQLSGTTIIYNHFQDSGVSQVSCSCQLYR